MMDEKKNEDLDAVEMMDEPEELEATEALDVAEAEEEVEDADPIAAVEAEPLDAEPGKPGCIRSFFKNKRMAIGICVLAVLLVANVAVFGAHKHCGKGIRDHGGKAVAACEYKQGPKAEMPCCKSEMGEKGSGYKDSCEDMDCQHKDQCKKEAGKEKGASKGKGARGDK